MSGIKDLDIANRSGPNKKETDDEDIKKLLKKMMKQRAESIDIYKKNNRKDLLEVEEKESEILSNQALIEGGAIYQSGNSIVLYKTAVIGNVGLDFGGALVCYGGLLDVYSSTVAGNNANYGSALCVRESNIVIKNSIFFIFSLRLH